MSVSAPCTRRVCGSVCVSQGKFALPRKMEGERVLMKRWDLPLVLHGKTRSLCRMDFCFLGKWRILASRYTDLEVIWVIRQWWCWQLLMLYTSLLPCFGMPLCAEPQLDHTPWAQNCMWDWTGGFQVVLKTSEDGGRLLLWSVVWSFEL